MQLSYTYAEEINASAGTAFGVQVTDPGSAPISSTSPGFTVADATLTATATTDHAVEGQPLSNVQVATFTDDPLAPLSDFPPANVTINWGNSDSSNATAVTQPGGVGTPFEVFGSHTYADEGSSTVSVSIRDSGGSTSDSTTISAGTVSTFLAPHSLELPARAGLQQRWQPLRRQSPKQ